MFSSYFSEPFTIRSMTEFTLDSVLSLSDVSSLFYINKEYLRSEEEKLKFDEFAALYANKY